jgi:hypothetical protein
VPSTYIYFGFYFSTGKRNLYPKTLGVRHNEKTKRAFCICGKYNELYREGALEAYVFENPLINILLNTLSTLGVQIPSLVGTDTQFPLLKKLAKQVDSLITVYLFCSFGGTRYL